MSEVTNDLERILNQPNRIYTTAPVEEAEIVEEEFDEQGLRAPLLVAPRD